jgi:DNA polymerase-3 subunit delta'
VSPFDGILGHEASIAALKGLLSRGRMPHSMLLHGPVGVGKATVASRLTRALLCRDSGCGRCEDCSLFDAGNHPDYVFLTLELRSDSKTEYKKLIVVDQVRRISSLIALAPRHGARRVFVIDPADRMNAEAQNALLKTLEEPPPRAVILLIASRPQVLVATVRSRCFALGFGPLRADALARMLQARGFDRREALERAALAEGRPGRAIELDLARLRERRSILLDGLERLAERRDLRVIESLGTALAGKNEPALQSNLELLMALLRDAARAAASGDTETLVHLDVAERLQRLGQTLGAERAAELVAATDRMRDQLRFNLNRSLVAESLLAAVAGGPLP